MPVKKKWFFGSLFHKISFKSSINLLIALVILSSILVSLIVARSYIIDKSIRDASALYFLNIERLSSKVTSAVMGVFLLSSTNKKRSVIDKEIVVKEPDFVIGYTKIDNQKKSQLQDFKGNLSQTKRNQPDFSRVLALDFEGQDIQLFQIDGFDYIGVFTDSNNASLALGQRLPGGRYLLIWRFSLSELFTKNNFLISGSEIFIFSKLQQLIFASNNDLKIKTIQQSDVLKKYISSPIDSGQYEIMDGEKDYLVYFHKIPDTNAVLFSKISKSLIADQIDTMIYSYASYLAGFGLFLLLFFQVFTHLFFRTLQRLSLGLLRIRSGDYRHPVKLSGFRESYTIARDLEYLRENLSQADQQQLQPEIRKLTDIIQTNDGEVNSAFSSKDIACSTSHDYIIDSHKKVKFVSHMSHEDKNARVWHSSVGFRHGGVAVTAFLEGHEPVHPALFGILSASFFSHVIGARRLSVNTYFKHMNTILMELKIFTGKMHLSVCIIDYNEKKLSFHNVGSVCNFMLLPNVGVQPITSQSLPISIDRNYEIASQEFALQEKLELQIILYAGHLQTTFVDQNLSQTHASRIFESLWKQQSAGPSQTINSFKRILVELGKSEKHQDVCLLAMKL